FRVHPNDVSNKRNIKNNNIEISRRPNINDDWAESRGGYFFGSHACVDAAIKGIPIAVYSKISVAYPYTYNDINDFTLKTFNREQWLYNLAYSQWNSYDIEEGKAWAHLRPYIYKG